MSNHQLSMVIRIVIGQLNERNEPDELNEPNKLNELNKRDNYFGFGIVNGSTDEKVPSASSR
jgi:hypothetical protein